MIENPVFNELIERFKELPLSRKKELTIEEVKKIIGLLVTLKKQVGLAENIMLNKEILDVGSNDINEEDFVEAMYVYMHTIEEALAEYLERTIS